MQERTMCDVGPVYAVRDYMRRLEAACRIPLHEDGEWYNMLLGMSAGGANRCHRRFRSSITDGLTSQRMLSVTETAGRRLGRPTSEFVMLRAGHGEIKRLGSDRTLEGVYLTRDYVRLEHDRAEHVESIPFVFFSTHSLERIHQRERCGAAGIDEVMRERMVTADGDLAFASIAGLSIPGENEVVHQLVPFGDGLLVATLATYVSPAGHPVPMVVRKLFKRSVIDQRYMPIRPELLGTMPEGLKGHCSQIFTLARTYLSSEMLRPAQEEYRRLFMDEAASFDRQKMAAALYMPVKAHEKVSLDGIMASPRLRALLAESLNSDHYPAVWEAAGSKKDESRDEDESFREHGRTRGKLKVMRGDAHRQAAARIEKERAERNRPAR